MATAAVGVRNLSSTTTTYHLPVDARAAIIVAAEVLEVLLGAVDGIHGVAVIVMPHSFNLSWRGESNSISLPMDNYTLLSSSSYYYFSSLLYYVT